jgi:ABC-type uncharacterized transport system ATPase subunit
MIKEKETIVLQTKEITKQFPGVLANDKVDFELVRTAPAKPP